MASLTLLGFFLALLSRRVYAQVDEGDGDGGDFPWGDYDGNRIGNGEGPPSGPGPGTVGGSSGAFADFDVEKATRDRTSHAVLASLCFVVIFPLGAVLMRTLRIRSTWAIHAITQGVGFVLYVAAAALGIQLIETVKVPPDGSSLLEISSANAHPIIGITLLVVMFIQPQLGFAHHSQFKRLKRRTMFSHMHLWLGRIAITLGIINGGLGLRLGNAPQEVVAAYSVVAAAAWLLWFAIAVLGECHRREQQQRGRRREAVPRAHVGDPPLPPVGVAPDIAPPVPSFARDGQRHLDSTLDDPSPPYSPRAPGHPPGYMGPRGGEAVEMVPMKNTARRGESASSFSSGWGSREPEW